MSNKNISCCTTTFRSDSKSNSNQSKSNRLLRIIEKQVLNPDSFFLIKINDNNNNSNLMLEKNEFKTTKEIIERINNDCNIIDKYIRDKKRGLDTICHKNDKEKILLKLADRLQKNKLKQLTSGITGNKQKRQKRQNSLLEDEKIYGKKLEKMPLPARKFFRMVYKQILYEKRILNKDDTKNIIDEIEEMEKKKRFYSNIKKEVKRNMILTKDNFVTDKDDKRIIDEQKKMIDYYGNLDGLEWLINKRHILNCRKNSK
jgi:hypothetical protein